MISLSALIYILTLLFCLFAALFFDAAYGIFMYVLQYFLNPPGRWWGSQLPELRYSFTIGIITLVGYLIRSGRYSGNKIFDAPQFKWLVLFAALMILTSPIALDQYNHNFFLTIFIKYLFLYFLIVKTIDTPQKFEKMIGIFLLGQFYLGWIAYELGRDSGGRLENLAGADSRDSNMAAAVIIVAVPLLIKYIVSGKNWQKFCALFMLVFIFNAVILVNSRGAFIAVIAGVVYFFYLSLKLPSFAKVNKLTVILGIAVSIAFFLYLTDPIFWQRMLTIVSDTADSEHVYTGRERLDFWIITFDMLKDHPFGAGAWGYQALSSQYLPYDALSSGSGTRAVHSTYFQVLAEYGYHGFLIFMAFIYSNFRYLKKIRKTLIQNKSYEPYYMAIALEAGLLAHLVAAAFIDRLYSEILYMTSAFIAAYGNIYLKQMKQTQEITNNIK